MAEQIITDKTNELLSIYRDFNSAYNRLYKHFQEEFEGEQDSERLTEEAFSPYDSTFRKLEELFHQSLLCAIEHDIDATI